MLDASKRELQAAAQTHEDEGLSTEASVPKPKLYASRDLMEDT